MVMNSNLIPLVLFLTLFIAIQQYIQNIYADNNSNNRFDYHIFNDRHRSLNSDHPSLFEAVSHINPQVGSFSVLIIIGFIIILRKTFDTLHYFTDETSFRPMLILIEEELMIVGVSSFILKILANTYIEFTNSPWYYPLEFSELLIPILAFSYCMMGIILIITSLNQVYWWNRAHHMKVMETLDEYFQQSSNIMFRSVTYLLLRLMMIMMMMMMMMMIVYASYL